MVQNQGVCNDLLSWLEPRFDFLQACVVTQNVATDNFDPLKSFLRRLYEDKITVVHAQHRKGKNNCVHLLRLPSERGSDEHSQPHHAWVLDLDPHFGGPNTWIENRADIADTSFEHMVGISVQNDLRRITQPDGGTIVFVHIADDPDR